MYWFNNKIVLCGPFVGSIGCEFFDFRPFVYWLKESFDIKNLIVCTHGNRSFLYDLPVLPIFKQYSIDETQQQSHKHNLLNSKDYTFLTNEMKDQISQVTNYNKSDIISYNLGYMTSPNIYSYQKIFNNDFSVMNTTDDFLFIPTNNRSTEELNFIYDNVNGLVVIGDANTELQQYNTIDCGYDDLYKTIIERIKNCKGVITPLGEWTVICNILGVPVFSWGENVSWYKNDKSKTLPCDQNVDKKILINSIKKFMKEK